MADEKAQVKAIMPFLQRADEVMKMEPKVAYYCRMSAVEVGVSFKPRSADFEGVLGALMAKLEKDKAAAGLGGNEADREYCRNFAEAVFARADKVDRAGKADKGTAMTFYAASVFIEVLRQFYSGEVPQDLADIQKYAVFKAADIRKALREGRTPTPGNGKLPPEQLLSGGELPDVPSGVAGDGGPPPLLPPAFRDGDDLPSTPGRPSAGDDLPSLPPRHSSEFASQPPASFQPPPPAGPPGGYYDGPDASHQRGAFGSDVSGGADVQQGGYSEQGGSSSPQPTTYGQPSSSYEQQPGKYDQQSGAPTAASGGGGGGGPDGLPSAPSFTRSISVASSADQQPTGYALAPRYPAGSRVLYDAFDQEQPVQGTVAKVDWQEKKWLYTVALAKQIVRVEEHILAPDFRLGEKVLFRSQDGAHAMPATVISTDATQWRPAYTIRLESGQELQAGDDQLVAAERAASQGLELESHESGPTGTSVRPSEPHSPAGGGGGGGGGPFGAPPPSGSPAYRQPPPQPSSTGPYVDYSTLRPTKPSAPPPPARQASGPPSPPRRQQPAAHNPAASSASVPDFTPSLNATSTAQKFAKQAASSLSFDDVDSAVKNLQDALRLLTQP